MLQRPKKDPRWHRERFAKGKSMTVTYYIEGKRNDLPIARESTTPGTGSPKRIEIRMV